MKERKLVNKQGLTESEFLAAYDVTKYERPSVTVDMLVFTVTAEKEDNFRRLPEQVLRLLMIKRGDHPCLGQWALPGGFVEPDETLEDAAKRELKEETNIDNIYMEQLYTWGDLNRDPRTRIISVSYMSLVDHTKLNIRASDDADDAQWFTVICRPCSKQKNITETGYKEEVLHQLTLTHGDLQLSGLVKTSKTVAGKSVVVTRELVESKGIAADHAKIIQYAIERLRNKIEYTAIAFQLMPERFTLTQLQQVYEVILDKPLLKANFRRKIAHMVQVTDSFTKNTGHRPSRLYKFNLNWEET